MKGSIAVVVAALLVTGAACAFGSSCGSSHAGEAKGGVYEAVLEKAADKDGVREITYEQFQEIRDSKEDYVLLDVLGEESFKKGHIEGAKNFPYKTITKESAGGTLSKDDKIVVYCGGFLCKASTKAAKKLRELGYKVVDYKGGLQEWKEKGNTLDN